MLLASLRFLRSAIPCFVHVPCQCRVRGVDSLWSPGLIRDFTWTHRDLSSSRETSNVCSPCSSDPGRITAFDQYKACDIAPLKFTGEAPAIGLISRLNSKAFKLTVYASQHRVNRWSAISYRRMITHTHAKLVSGGGQPYRAGSSCKVLYERCCTC